MSHTGVVHRPNQSPGLIRIITVGYAISNGKGNGNNNLKNRLIFATPKKDENPTESVRERFVVFSHSDNARFYYGDAVKFNLRDFDDWKHTIDPDDLKKLKMSIPMHWQQELGWYQAGKLQQDKFDDFEFKYIATKIEPLPEDFILHPLYKFIEDLDEDSREKVLLALAKIPNYNFKQFVEVECTKGSHGISGIHLMDSSDFDRKGLSDEKHCFDQAYKNEEGVLEEIEELQEHKISSVEEIPTRVGKGKMVAHS